MSPSVAPSAGETETLAHIDTEEDLAAADETLVEEVINRDSCEEVSRQAEIASTTVFFGSEETDESTCALVLRFMGSTVPALPGLGGFDVADLGNRSPRYTLANEPDNHLWSRPMEARILAEIPGLVDFPIFTVHAVCRSNTCGVLFAYTDAAYSGGKREAYARQLAEALEFSGYVSGERRQMGTGTGFTYIYLGDWEMTQRSQTSKSPPMSFEELLDAADQNN